MLSLLHLCGMEGDAIREKPAPTMNLFVSELTWALVSQKTREFTDSRTVVIQECLLQRATLRHRGNIGLTDGCPLAS